MTDNNKNPENAGKCIDQVREAIFERGELLKNIGKYVPGGIFVYSADEDARFSFVSDNMLEMLGYTKEEFDSRFGGSFREMIYPDDREDTLRTIDEQIETDAYDTCFYRIERKDGSLIWVHDEGHLVTDENGKKWFYVVIVDNTDTMNASKSLADQNSELQKIIDNIPFRLVVYRRAGGKTTAVAVNGYMAEKSDERYAGIVGMSEEELRSLVHPEDTGRVKAFFSGLYSGAGPRHEIEYRTLTDADDAYKWYSCSAVATHEPDGSTLIYCAYVDITAQKQNEKEFGMIIQDFLKSNPRSIYAFRMNLTGNTCGEFHGASKYTRQLSDAVSADDLLARLRSVITDAEDIEKFSKIYTRKRLLECYAEGKMQLEISYRRMTDDGDIHWVTMYTRLLQNPYSGDTEAVAYSEEDDQMKLQEAVLGTVTSEEFECIGVMEPDKKIIGYYHGGPDSGNVSTYDEHLVRVMKLMTPEEAPGFADKVSIETITEKLARGREYALSYSSFDKHGNVRRKHVNFRYLYGENRRILFARADVTAAYEQEQAQSERMRMAEAAEQRLSDYEAIPSGIGIFDVCGNRIQMKYLNDGYYQMLNTNREDRRVFSDGVELAIFPEDIRELREEITASMRDRRQFDCKVRIVDGSGKYRWAEIRANHEHVNAGTERFYAAYYDIDELVRTQSDLQEKEIVFRDLLSYSDVIQFTYYPDRHRYEAAVFPVKFAELPNAMDDFPGAFAEFVNLSDEDAAAFMRMVQQIDAGEQEAECTVWMTHGSISGWYRVHLFSIFDNSGKVLKAVGNIANADKEKEAEQAVRNEMLRIESLSGIYLYAACFNVTKDICVESNRDSLHAGRSTFGEDIFREAVEIEPALARQNSSTRSVILTAAEEIADRKQREEFLRTFSNAGMLRGLYSGRYEAYMEYRRNISSGARWVSSKYILIRDPRSGEILSFVYTRDITDQKKTEQISRLTIEENCDFIALVDPVREKASFRVYSDSDSLYIKSINRDREFDYAAGTEYAINRSVAYDERKMMREQLSLSRILAALETSKIYTVTYERFSAAGDVQRKQIQYQWLDDSRSELLAIQTDITAAYVKEQERLIRMKEAMEAAEKANRAKTEFLSRISHDIRTPISIIKNMTIFAKEDIKDEAKLKDDLDKIEASNTFLLSLINDVLDISKIDSERIELSPEPYPYDEYSEDMRNLLEPMCAEKGISFSIERKNNFRGVIVVDKTRLRQITLNILSNAVKYTPRGGSVRYVSESRDLPDAKVRCCFSIIDTGIGMSREFQKTMFDAFTQEYDNPLRPKGISGTGLGLSIVRRMVEIMGGNISVTSDPGKGTTVMCSFVFPDATRDPKYSGALRTDRNSGTEKKSLSGTVLLVDDNVINQEITVRILNSIGMDAETAENGAQAVRMFSDSEQGRYKAILMDIQMPVMNGYDATAAIRALPRPDARTIPVIAMTADAYVEAMDRCIEVGMDEYLTKPIEADRVCSVLSKLIDGD